MRELTEAEFRHKSNVYDQLAEYAGNGYFVHFGDSPKVGVKPQSFHSDPTGVYFYSLDWLLLHPRFYKEGSQFAVDRRYWTIAKLVSNNGIVFSELTYPKLEEIAERNNFQKWDIFIKTQKRIDPKNSPALALWDYLKMHRKDAGNKPLVGIDFLYDDGLGIIHSREPNQLVVINPRAITTIAKGEQIPESDQSDYLITKVMKNIQLRYGGEITWHKKTPKLVIDRGYTKFLVTYEKERGPSLRLKMNWGRAEKIVSIKRHDLEHGMTFSEIMGKIEGLFDGVIRLGKAKKDLFFAPHLDPKQVLTKMRSLVTDGFTFETLIENERKEITVTAHRDIKIDGVSLSTVVTCRISDDPRWNVRVSVNSFPFAQSLSMDSFPDDLATNAQQSVARLTETKKPSLESAGRGWYDRRFYNESDYREFIGWVAANCGIRDFSEEFKEEVIEYNSLRDDDKKYLAREIKRVF